MEISTGSSPRMWGTQKTRKYFLKIKRFIPTHVGNTVQIVPPLPSRTVHPHACGEHFEGNRINIVPLGSSPRMWGTPSRDNSEHREIRFIPTHVGNTLKNASAFFSASVHPHACGEHTSYNTAKSNRVFKDQKSTNKISQNYRQPVLHHFQAKKKRV